jgi:hypothetical protein
MVRVGTALLAFAVAGVALACEREERAPPAVVRTATGIWVDRAVLRVAEATDFAYLQNLSQAEAGEKPALRELLVFCQRLDGSAKVHHGIVLIELLGRTGDEAFARVAEGLAAEQRAPVLEALRIGAQETRRGPLRGPLERGFPLTTTALRSDGGDA